MAELGSLFNVNKENKENKKLKRKEIKMENLITVKATTVTPLIQLDDSGNQRKRYVLQDGYSFKEPFWSANGLRGALRRVLTKDLATAIISNEENFKMKAEEMFLYTAGAGADVKSIENVNFENESFVREKAPILSLFGAGLSQISGKIAIEDMTVFNDEKYFLGGKENNTAFSKFLETQTFYRDDTSKKLGFLSELVDRDDVARWQEENLVAVKESKEAVASGEAKKEKTSNMQQPFTLNMIKAETPLRTCINPINHFEFTDVELGCIVKGLLEIAPLQIGSAKRYGFGRLDWEVSIDGEQLFTLKRDREFSANYDLYVSEKAKKIISIYDEWLKENAISENIEIASILKQFTKSSKAS